MLAHRILDRLDPAWPKALFQADMKMLGNALIDYQAGLPISNELADQIAEQVFIACLYNGETQ